MIEAMRFLLVAVLAVLVSCSLQVEAGWRLPLRRTQQAFTELRSAQESASTSEAESQPEEGAESSHNGPSGSSDQDETEDSGASSAGSQAENQEASKQDQAEQAPEGSSAETEEPERASAATSAEDEKGKQPDQQQPASDVATEPQKTEAAGAEQQEQNDSSNKEAEETEQASASEQPAASEGESQATSAPNGQQPSALSATSESATEKSEDVSPEEGKPSSSAAEPQPSEAESTGEQPSPPAQGAPEESATQKSEEGTAKEKPTVPASESRTSETESAGEKSSVPSSAAPEGAPESAGSAAPAVEEMRMQSIAPHVPAEHKAPEEKPPESPGGPKVEEITAHCLLTHNKIRTARLDQWPDPLSADDGLAEAARDHAKEYIANNCKLPTTTKIDPLRELMAPKSGNACEGLDYVFLDGLSDLQRSVKDDYPGPFNPSDSKSAWHSENAQKLALIMSETGKLVGCAGTVGCSEDVFFCNYGPSLATGKEILSKHVYSALKKRERVEAHGKTFLAGVASDHEVKHEAGAKVAMLESGATFSLLSPTAVTVLALSLAGALQTL